MLRRTLSLALLFAVSLGASGCFLGRSSPKPLPPPSPLRLELEDFAVYTATRVELAADDILERDESAAINRNTLFWRMRIIPECRRTLVLADDEAVLLGMWLISRRMTHFLEKGEGVEYFGKAQAVALQACQEIEARIEKIATKALDPKELASADKHIAAYAGEHPVSNRLDVAPGTDESWGALMSSTLGKPFSVLETPLSHVSPTSGLSDAAVAAHRVAVTVEQLSTLARYLPANVRWQTDLLVLELEESKSVKSSLAALHQIGEGSESIAATAAKLPVTLREEMSKLVDELDAKQSGLQATLDKAHATATEAHATATEARAAVESMDKTLVQLDTVVTSTEPTAESLARMGGALTGTFEAFTKMMEVLKAPSPDPAPPAAEPGPPFDVNDYGRNAEKITATMKEMSAVLARVEDLTQQDRFAALVGSADGAVQSTLDYFFVGSGLLVLFIFLVALGYRFLTRFMQPRRPA